MAKISQNELIKAVDSLNTAFHFASKQVENSDEFKIARDACIQRFEFCVELAWKVSAKYLGVKVTTPKVVLRQMHQSDAIEDISVWFEFIEARNKSSHTYDEKIAKEVYDVIPRFFEEVKKIIFFLKSLE